MKPTITTFFSAAGMMVASLAVVLQHAAGADVATTQPPTTDVQILALAPPSNAMLGVPRPGFTGQFGVPIDPNSVSIKIDGQDISQTGYVASNEFLFTAPADLSAQQHTAEMSGKAMNGAVFDRTWSFTTAANGSENFLVNLSPPDGSAAGGAIVVSGSTLLNAHVRVVVGSATLPNGLLVAAPGTFAIDTVAGNDGRFSVPIDAARIGSGPLTVRIISIEPTTFAGVTATLHLHS